MMMKHICVLLLVFAMLAPGLSADQQSAQGPAKQERFHPYKKAGLIMIGIGGLVSLAAVQRVAGLEGLRFQTCVADAANRGVRSDCASERAPNPSLVGIGVALLGGGLLIGLQRATRTPQIEFGRGRLLVVSRMSF
jgi:hypothetical protein